jgi:hypothetical protein
MRARIDSLQARMLAGEYTVAKPADSAAAKP